MYKRWQLILIKNFTYLFPQVMVLNKSKSRYQMQIILRLEQAWQTAMERWEMYKARLRIWKSKNLMDVHVSSHLIGAVTTNLPLYKLNSRPKNHCKNLPLTYVYTWVKTWDPSTDTLHNCLSMLTNI